MSPHPLHHSFSFFLLSLPHLKSLSLFFISNPLHLLSPPFPKHSQINFNTIYSLKARACPCLFITSSPLKEQTQTLLSSLILRSLLQISCFPSQKPKHAAGSDWAWFAGLLFLCNPAYLDLQSALAWGGLRKPFLGAFPLPFPFPGSSTEPVHS